MNVFDTTAPGDTTLPKLPDDTLVMLRRWAETADHRADELATRGGKERETAAHHMRSAELYDEQAVAARARADELREVIAIVEERRRAAEAAALVDRGPLDGAS